MEKLKLLYHQYQGFHDAVIRNLTYSYKQGEYYERILSIEIECMRFDIDEEAVDTPWELILLKLMDVKSFIFREPINCSNVVLSDVTYLFEKEYYYFDFSSFEKLTLAEIQKQSSFYIMCKDIVWTVIKNLE